MKRIKKIASLVLAMVMVLAMSVPVMAADNHEHTITVKQNVDDVTEHTYDAYQIFAGDLAEVDGNKVLSNIIWGSGVNGEALLAALKADTTFNVVGEEKNNAFANCTTAAAVAKVLEGEAFGSSDIKNSTLTDAFARVVENNLTDTVAGTETGTGDVKISVTGSGYYLVKDQDGTVDTENGAYSRFMLEVVGDATATVKSEVPHGDKQVYLEGTDGTFVPGDANYSNIGSHVSYVITSEVPNYAGYEYYYFVMNDTLSKGLTFDGASTLTVTVGGRELIQSGEGVTNPEYYVYTGDEADGYTFRLAFENIKNFTIGDEIVVTYSATVNDEVEIGSTGNPNEWTLKYSNNPNESTRNDGPRPGLPLDEENGPFGETPKELTLTYVTELDITKYANEVAADHLLAGAEFTLTGTSNQVVLKDVEYYETSADGTYYLLLDGTYTETAPSGTEYVEIGVGTAETTTGYIKNEAGEYIVPSNAADYVGETLYKLVKGSADQYADVNTKYVKKTEAQTVSKDVNVSIEMTTDADGKAYFKGLGAGEYTLTETVTPEGFNTLDPITIVISFRGPEVVNTGEEPGFWAMTWNGESIDGGATGIFAQNVINQSGSLLPSTGGIGTTIFYVLGGILVVGACVLLVVRKRMSKSE